MKTKYNESIFNMAGILAMVTLAFAIIVEFMFKIYFDMNNFGVMLLLSTIIFILLSYIKLWMGKNA